MIHTYRFSFVSLFSSIFLLTVLYSGQCQNLVPNFSFEILSFCPIAIGGQGPTPAPPWIPPTLGTPDIFNSCELGVVGVPFNFAGTQDANTGEGYAGIYVAIEGQEYREYLQAPLLEPLEAGVLYTVSFYVVLAEFSCASQYVGAYLSEDAPNNFSSSSYLNVTPQVESNLGFLSDEENWTLITDCILAAGGEQFITIGNFRPESQTPILLPCDQDLNYSYYYIEDIIVEEMTGDGDLPIELGGPEIVCLEYVIDPDYDSYFYTWEDGSHGPTFTVNETGIYSLTISEGCSFGVDSIEIIVQGDAPVDLGPESVTICDGDAYVISLDPNFNSYEWNDGSTDSEYTITTSGTYSVTLDDGCEVSTDEVTVEVVDSPPNFDLGGDMFLCFGLDIDISLDPSLGEFLWQDNNTSPGYTITSEGEYSVTVTNVCGMESDAIIITALEAPEIDIGPDHQTLCTGETIEINIDAAQGEITWQDGKDDNPYLITTSGTYSVILSNECGSAFDQMDVVVADIPFINFGPDTVICDTSNLILSASVVGGNFHWQDNSTNDTLIVTGPGVYSLFVNNFCGFDTDTIIVDFGTPVVPPDLGPDLNLCPGEQIILLGGQTGVNTLWQDGFTADSFLVTTAGVYFVMVSSACSTATDTIIISMNGSAPVVDLPDQITLCQGQSTILEPGINGVDYLWNDNSQHQQLSISLPGTYSVTVSNGCGTDRDTTVVLDDGPAPQVSLGNDIDICHGDMVPLTPTYSDVTSWLWQDGSVLPDFVVSTGGMITVQASNACGSTADTLLVNVLPATPPLDLGSDTSLCSGESFVLSINTPGVTILWPDGSSTTDYSVTGPGSVYASISNSCGQSYDTIQVYLLPDIPVLNLGPDQSLCPGELIVFNPGITDVDYLWQDGSTSTSFQTTQQGTIILSISNECGVTADTVVIIESTQGPQVDLGPDIQVCEGEIVTILSGISGVNYVWQDGSTNPDYITAQSGEFILQVSNNCGSDSDTLVVDISGVPPTPVLGPDTTFCEGITLNLISTADQETTIEWQDGSSTPIFTVSAPGTYILSESNRCGDASDTLVISYLDAPDPFSFGPDTILCPGETITLNSPSTAFEIRWQDGSDQPSIIVDVASTYTLQLSNDCGVVMDAIQVDFDNRIPQLNLDPMIPWCDGDVIDLDATQPFLAEYSWSTGEITPLIQISTPGIYNIDVNTYCQSASQTVEVFEDTNCIEVVIDRNYEIFIPNVFSPNGDGMNDVFTMSLGADLHPTSIVGSIFDRWGNLVYHSDALTFLWDGYFADKTVMPGVYVYAIKVKYIELGIERVEELVGDVTLLR